MHNQILVKLKIGYDILFLAREDICRYAASVDNIPAIPIPIDKE